MCGFTVATPDGMCQTLCQCRHLKVLLVYLLNDSSLLKLRGNPIDLSSLRDSVPGGEFSPSTSILKQTETLINERFILLNTKEH